MRPGFRVQMLAPEHDRRRFSCGVEPLDSYFRERAGQDVKRRVSNCFVLLDGDAAVAGFYTFAATSLPLTELSEPEKKRLPRYPLMPAALIGRLAIDQGFRGQGLGSALVIDAALRAARSDPAIFALIVDAKDEAAVAFYRHLEFRVFESRPQSLFLPVATALQALA
jgi:ribosomal protein S18 acetylase RimI-like enzyme